MENDIDQIPQEGIIAGTPEVDKATEEIASEATPTDTETTETPGETPKETEATVETTEETAEGETTPAEGSEHVVVDLEPTKSEETSTGKTSGLDLSEIAGGKYKTAEELNSYLEGLENKDTTPTEEREGPFYNELSEAFNNYVSRGGDPAQFMQLQGTDVNNLGDLEAMKLDLMWNKGFSEQDAKAHLDYKYKQDAEKHDEDEVKAGKFELQSDAAAARDGLKSFQHENKIPERENHREAFQQEQMERMNPWFPHIDKAIESVTNNGILIPIGSSNKGLKYKAEVTDEIRTRFEDAIFNYGDGPPSTEEAKEVLVALCEAHYRPDINKVLVDKVRSNSDKDWFEKTHNPSAKETGDPVEGVPEAGKSIEDQVGGFF